MNETQIQSTKLHPLGQSAWIDAISRDMLRSGELKTLRDEFGVRGLTSNPTIFDNAISKTTTYDEKIKSLKGKTASEIFEEIAVEDIGDAADLFLPVWESSEGEDGWVSIEVSPLLARDTTGTIEEAKRLHSRLNRKNVMIKIPGTKEGLPAIEAVLSEGISVNVTLLFSVPNYVEVAKTYIRAIRNRSAAGKNVSHIRSVASFFVSRVDSLVDSKLAEIAKDPAKTSLAQSLMGKIGIANSKLAYLEYQKLFESPDFASIPGANVQRPLWASTSTKNPAYRDVSFVEGLIGNNTVNTLPLDTLKAFADHGTARITILDGITEAQTLIPTLSEIGIDVDACLHQLQVEGVQKFSDSFTSLMKSIEGKS